MINNLLAMLLSNEGNLAQVLEKLIDGGMTLGGRVVGAIVIFIIGRYIIKLINSLVDKILAARDVDRGVRSFLRSMLNILLMVLLIVAIIDKLGIETTSFAALLASFGVAVGMALSGNLSNFVGGILILVFKPYRVGDWIRVDGTLGQVISIESFHTVMRTYAGEHVYMGNDSMSKAKVINYSKQPTLRIEFKVGVEYGTDCAAVERVLREIAEADGQVLREPAPAVALDELGDNAVVMFLRVWVKKEDYWTVLYRLNRRIYDRFNEEGLPFAFPQLTIHQG